MPARRSVTPAATSGGTPSIVRARSSRPSAPAPRAAHRHLQRPSSAARPRTRPRAAVRCLRWDRRRRGPHGIQPDPKRATRAITRGLTRAADPDRHAAGLRGLGHLVDALELQRRRRERRPLLAPQRLAHGERLVEQAAPAVEVEPGRVVLLALPADADAEVESAAREHVERRRGLGEHDRPPQRGDEDVRAQPDACVRPATHARG